MINLKIKPNYEKLDSWASYANDIMVEYAQCIDEGLCVEQYKELFEAVSKLENTGIKKDFADVIQKIVRSAKIRDDYKYNEPSTLDEIKVLRKEHSFKENSLDAA